MAAKSEFPIMKQDCQKVPSWQISPAVSRAIKLWQAGG